MDVLLKGLAAKYPENESIKFLLLHQVKLNFVLVGHISDAFEQLPEEKFFPHLMSLLDSVVFFYTKYQGISDPDTRVKRFHQDVDEIISQDLFGRSDLNVSCSKGCSACCSQYVTISKSEGDLLLQSSGPLPLERLHKQASLTEDTWTDSLTEPEGKCVFLDEQDGSCSVWINRPANCRNYFVSGSSAGCSVFNRDSNISRSYKSIYADVCISAFYSLDGGEGSMSSFLFERLK